MTKRQQAKARLDAIHETNRQIVVTGKCPDCGAGLVRNSSLRGWWQCGAFGRLDFRKPEYRVLPDCGFQCFTE